MPNQRVASSQRQNEDQLSPRFRTQSTLGSCLARRSLATRQTHGSHAELRETTRVAAQCSSTANTVIYMRSMVKVFRLSFGLMPMRVLTGDAHQPVSLEVC